MTHIAGAGQDSFFLILDAIVSDPFAGKRLFPIFLAVSAAPERMMSKRRMSKRKMRKRNTA